jgi:hypothetical protein
VTEDDDDPPYDVGYRRPPKAHQWGPGVSGNPKGRPKGQYTLGELAELVVGQSVKVEGRGGQKEMALMRVILERAARDAAKGDLAAAKFVIAQLPKGARIGEPELTDEELKDQLIQELTPEDLQLIDKIRDEFAYYAKGSDEAPPSDVF